MAAPQTVLFGRSGAMTPVPSNYMGQPGWYQLPTGFFTRPNPQNPSELIASPNEDFSAPVYYCTMSQDSQNFLYQDLLRSALDGTSGNNES